MDIKPLINAAIDARITASPDLSLFIDVVQGTFTGDDFDPDLTPLSFPVNPDCWAAYWSNALRCISPFNTHVGSKKAGTLVTRRHAIGAYHYNVADGRYLWFEDHVGNGEWYQITAHRRIGVTDTFVYELDRPVHATVPIAPILPSNWTDYFSSSGGIWGSGTCILKINAARIEGDIEPTPQIPVGQPQRYHDSKEVGLHETNALMGTYGLAAGLGDYPETPSRIPVYFGVMQGDSGNARFLPLPDGSVVYLGHYSGGAIHEQVDDIHDAIDDMGGAAGLRLTTVSFVAAGIPTTILGYAELTIDQYAGLSLLQYEGLLLNAVMAGVVTAETLAVEVVRLTLAVELERQTLAVDIDRCTQAMQLEGV